MDNFSRSFSNDFHKWTTVQHLTSLNQSNINNGIFSVRFKRNPLLQEELATRLIRHDRVYLYIRCDIDDPLKEADEPLHIGVGGSRSAPLCELV